MAIKILSVDDELDLGNIADSIFPAQNKER